MKARHQTILLIDSGSVELLAIDHRRIARSHRMALSEARDARAYIAVLAERQEELASVVRDWAAAGESVRVLYAGPSLRFKLEDYAVSSPSQACDAGRLSAVESVGTSVDRIVSSAVCLGRDASGESPRYHVAAAADRADVIEAIIQLIEQAGLTFQSATPVEACLIARLVRTSLADRDAPRARLYIGRNASHLCIGVMGRLVFSRRIPFGVDSLIAALQRPIRVEGRHEPVQLDEAAARQIIATHGLPAADTIVETAHAIRGAQVHPLLQPVLQRFIVELRQSLRFGSDEDVGEQLIIECLGPGRVLPGLLQELEAALETPVCAEASSETSTGEPGTEQIRPVFDALQDDSFLDALCLLPQRVVRQRTANRLRNWLWTGAAAAIVLIAIDAVRWNARLNQVERQVEVFAAQSADLESLRAVSIRMMDAIKDIATLEQAIQLQAERHVDFHALLGELSRLTPESIRFTTTSFNRVERRMTGQLIGIARSDAAPERDEAAPARTELRALVAQLREHPFFENVTLGTVTFGHIEGIPGERFEIRFDIASAPEPDDRPLVKVLQDGATP